MRQAKTIKQVAAGLQGRRRTSLYAWFWDHWDELPEYQRYRVDWQDVTTKLDALGLRGRDEDKPLSSDLVRMTFQRVVRDKAAQPATPAKKQTTEPAPVRSTAPTFTPASLIGEEPPAKPIPKMLNLTPIGRKTDG
jgi:hypothetical protein